MCCLVLQYCPADVTVKYRGRVIVVDFFLDHSLEVCMHQQSSTHGKTWARNHDQLSKVDADYFSVLPRRIFLLPRDSRFALPNITLVA
jgi:hypothetical protein